MCSCGTPWIKISSIQAEVNECLIILCTLLIMIMCYLLCDIQSRCEHGILAICYGEGDLELYEGKLELQVNSWNTAPVLSLREAAALSNPKNKIESSRCNCRSGCKTSHCACQRKNAPCNSKCHGGTSCTNCSDEAVITPPRKKYKTALGSPIVISDTESPAPRDTWIPELKLNANDKNIIMKGKWLSDKHIVAAQTLLKQQFSHIGGLQPPIFNENNSWDIMRMEGVQILNDSNIHWLCISTMGCSTDVVDIYDSIKTKSKKPSSHIKEQVAAILHSPADSITLRTIESQEQHNGSDCGVYAIATAVSLCNGIPPIHVVWDQTKMREHLFNCFENRLLIPFPGSKSANENTVIATTEVKLYCNCRFPENRKKKMAQCGICYQWYHQGCEQIPEAVFKENLILFAINVFFKVC